MKHNTHARAWMSDHHHRRSIRLPGYEYSSAGAYFVTLCAKNRECLFGDVVDGEMRLNDAGRMVATVWNELPVFYPGVDIDAFVVMPNHVHGVIVVGAAPCGRPDGDPDGRPDSGQPRDDGQPQGVAPTPVGGTLSLPDAVHRFKTMTTKRYIDGVKQSGWSPFNGRLWQRNYYERIVRNDAELNRIRQYITDNPAGWVFDRENPDAAHKGPEEAWAE